MLNTNQWIKTPNNKLSIVFRQLHQLIGCTITLSFRVEVSSSIYAMRNLTWDLKPFWEDSIRATTALSAIVRSWHLYAVRARFSCLQVLLFPVRLFNVEHTYMRLAARGHPHLE